MPIDARRPLSGLQQGGALIVEPEPSVVAAADGIPQRCRTKETHHEEDPHRPRGCRRDRHPARYRRFGQRRQRCAHQPLVCGGRRRNPDFPDLGFAQVFPGNPAVTGWTVGGNGIDYVGSLWDAADGDGHSIDLNSWGPGSVSQTVDTVAGQTYNVTFAMSGNPADGEDLGDEDDDRLRGRHVAELHLRGDGGEHLPQHDVRGQDLLIRRDRFSCHADLHEHHRSGERCSGIVARSSTT